jgi:hypothetical protein
MPLYLNGSTNIQEVQDDESIITFAGSLEYSTASGSNLDPYINEVLIRYDPALHTRFVLANFGYDVVQRSNFKNSWPTALKNSNVVWIMRGKRESDNDFITWRSPDTPNTVSAGTQIVAGTEKVIGYFYDDT